MRYQAATPTWAHFVTMEHKALQQWLPAFEDMPIPNLIQFLHFGHSELGRKMTGASEPTMVGAAVRVFPINQVPYELTMVVMSRLNATSFGSLLSAADADGLTPLMDASRVEALPEQGQPVIERLLAAGAGFTVDMTDRLGRTALMLACQHGFTTGARLLLAHHADTTRGDSAGHTALRHACDAGEPGPALLLLGANVPVDAAAVPSCLLMSARIGLGWALQAALVLSALYVAVCSAWSRKWIPRAWVSDRAAACSLGWMTASGADCPRRGRNGRRGANHRGGSRGQRQQPDRSSWSQLLACKLSEHREPMMAAACAFMALLAMFVCTANATLMSTLHLLVQLLAGLAASGLFAALSPEPDLTQQKVSRWLRVIGLMGPFVFIGICLQPQLIEPLQRFSNLALLTDVLAGKVPLTLAVWTRICCAAHLSLYCALVIVLSICTMHPLEVIRTRLPIWTAIRLVEGATGLNDLFLAAALCEACPANTRTPQRTPHRAAPPRAVAMAAPPAHFKATPRGGASRPL